VTRSDELRFDGLIAGASFDSGDQIVIGCWPSSPFGPFVDAMWARPDGSRALVVDGGPQADFIWSHYRFDERITCRTGARVTSERLRFEGGPLAVSMTLRGPGPLSFALGLRPRRLGLWRPWSWVEDGVVRPLLAPTIGAGVRARGVTRAGARERYVPLDVRWAHARATVRGQDLGASRAPRRPAGFGFSEFPSVPCAVRVTSVFTPSR
jgi:hypothetical protein